MKGKLNLLMGVLLMAPLFVAALSSSARASTTSPLANTEAGKTLYVTGSALSPYLGDPFQDVARAYAETTSAFFDPLTVVTSSNGASPWLAVKWNKVSPTAWDFTLRKGVKFSNGEPLDAQAVVAAVQGLHLPSEASATASLFLGQLASATAVSTYVVQLHTTTPDAILPEQVSALIPVPPVYFAQVGISGFATAPIGTGPYVVQSLSTTQMTLKANYNSWRKPKIGHIVVSEILDSTARLNAMLAGQDQVNLEMDIDQTGPLKAARFTINTTSNVGVFGIAFINEGASSPGPSSPLASEAVREALNYGVDRPLMLKTLYKGHASLASQGVTPGVVGYDPAVKPYPYDPAKARKLLAAAGYPHGFTFTADISVGVIPEDQQVYETVQSELAAIGVTLNYESMTGPQSTINLLTANWPGAQAYGTYFLSAPEQDATKAYSTHSCLRIPTNYCDPIAAQYLTEALVDRTGRIAALNKLAVEQHNDPPAIWLFNLDYLEATAKNVTGFVETANDRVNWEDLSMS